MIIKPHLRKLGTVRRFVPTSKDLPLGANYKDQAWYTLMGWVMDEFGEGGGTAEEIYHRVTGRKGLSADTTMELLYAARNGGYFRVE